MPRLTGMEFLVRFADDAGATTLYVHCGRVYSVFSGRRRLSDYTLGEWRHRAAIYGWTVADSSTAWDAA